VEPLSGKLVNLWFTKQTLMYYSAQNVVKVYFLQSGQLVFTKHLTSLPYPLITHPHSAHSLPHSTSFTLPHFSISTCPQAVSSLFTTLPPHIASSHRLLTLSPPHIVSSHCLQSLSLTPLAPVTLLLAPTLHFSPPSPPSHPTIRSRWRLAQNLFSVQVM
jgi:hypothetical protein